MNTNSNAKENAMFKKIAIASILPLMLSGCTIADGALTFSDSAQDKIEKIISLGADDITLATDLSSSEKLNDQEMAMCLPVFSKWVGKLKVQAANASKVKGAASALVIKRWYEKQIKSGVPSDVVNACSPLYVSEKGSVSDIVSFVKGIIE